MALALAIIGLSGAANRVQAQITIRNLIDLTNTVWKYNQNGTNLGTAWRATAYNDSAWASGKSILGFEDSVPFPYTNNPTIPFSQWTQLSLKGPGQANQTITYYFRTHFNFPSNATGVTLVSSNYIDDGALIYLNGQYAGGLRVTANSIFSAVASGGPATEGLLELINLPGTNLVRGDNVLAVEVHQSSTTSSDIVWAMSLNALLPIPIVITNQPDSQTIVAGDPVAFEIGVTGSNPTYNW